MKKIVLLLFVLAVFAGSPALFGQQKTTEKKTEAKTEVLAGKKAEPVLPGTITFGSVARKVVMYIPNRFLDLLDVFSLDLKMGPALEASAQVTQALGLGFGFGMAGTLSKDIRRRYGVCVTDGWKFHAGVFRAENIQRLFPHGGLTAYWRDGSNIPDCTDSFFDPKNGTVDYWSIEASAVAFAGARVAIHPLEIADLITGLFFYDLLDDDLPGKTY